MTEALTNQMIEWRRDFHRFPETGFLEMRTASIVASILDELGFELEMGLDVMDPAYCMGKPNDEETKEHYEWAIENGAHPKYVDRFSEGYTGIVATWDTKKAGPTTAFRFDMDALPIDESADADHFPQQKGFKSTQPYTMHACGHDAHTSMGLGLATLIAENPDELTGKIKIIFQPAEEGTRGAKSMAEKGVVDDVNYFIATHIGVGVPQDHIVAAKNGFLATSKLDVTFKGVSSHAGGKPEEGKNALLAAASAALNIYATPRHSEGATRINVGEFHAGTGRNIIADTATLKVETRGEVSSINEEVKQHVKSVIAGAAAMYQVDYEIETVGEALSSNCSEELAAIVHQCAEQSPYFEKSILIDDSAAGSEDATYFMDRVKDKGGQATYCAFGTDLAAGHHNEKFDINERTLYPTSALLYETIVALAKQS
ncbi:amidohydrolase [Oceanobacillus halotolerans]|uniref:amidohydrolase n=1 Tax=Oceanobacillus halotolerans TaxID=2663380 RepID=UPI0013D98F05|nr:amidohydrolase [Oceanobacillus halotolerans]